MTQGVQKGCYMQSMRSHDRQISFVWAKQHEGEDDTGKCLKDYVEPIPSHPIYPFVLAFVDSSISPAAPPPSPPPL